MTKLTHALFGPIDTADREHPCATSADFQGRSIDVDLHLEDDELGAADLEAEALRPVLGLVDDLAPLDAAARRAIAADATRGDEAAAALYASHHLEQLSDPQLAMLLPRAPRPVTPAAFLERLQLVRVGVYPASKDAPVLLDYSIDPDVTDHLLCVSFDLQGKVVAVEMES
jgi:hypothetical protein